MSGPVTPDTLLGQVPSSDGLPPVHLWNPPFCGDIDMRIGRDGTWFYHGTPINRKPMVKLFSTILRRESEGWFLVTPVEKVGIQVDDAPFVAVLLDVEGQGVSQRLHFTDNVGNRFVAGPEHPIRVATNPSTGEPAPYVRVRDNLDALIHRAVFYQLVDLAIAAHTEGTPVLGITSDNEFFVLGKAA